MKIKGPPMFFFLTFDYTIMQEMNWVELNMEIIMHTVKIMKYLG